MSSSKPYSSPRRRAKKPRYFSKSWRAYQKHLQNYFGSPFERMLNQKMGQPGFMRRFLASPEQTAEYKREGELNSIKNKAWETAWAAARPVYNKHRVYVVPTCTTTWELDYARDLAKRVDVDEQQRNTHV